MTNVPQNIRNIWTDIYKLFDLFYLMQNTEDDWNKFWTEGKRIWENSGKSHRVMEAISLVSDVIADRMKGETV